LPLCGSFCPEDPQCGSGDEVALQVEGVVNRGVHAEEALSSRLEDLDTESGPGPAADASAVRSRRGVKVIPDESSVGIG
jgi:hypothetical protein